MQNKIFTGLVTLAILVMSIPNASAATCSLPAYQDQGDEYYQGFWRGNQTLVDYWWDAFNFQADYWDDGFGYPNADDLTRPLGRMFNALYALGYSSTNSPTCSTSSSDYTKWAMCYAASKIKRTRAGCSNGSALAKTWWGPTVTNRTEFYMSFFFNQDVALRAGTVFHEGRHASTCAHNAKDSDCDRGASCDKSWEDGCKDIGNQKGANRYQVQFLASYVRYATRATSTLRTSARNKANDILGRAFKNEPCLVVASDGKINAC